MGGDFGSSSSTPFLPKCPPQTSSSPQEGHFPVPRRPSPCALLLVLDLPVAYDMLEVVEMTSSSPLNAKNAKCPRLPSMETVNGEALQRSPPVHNWSWLGWTGGNLTNFHQVLAGGKFSSTPNPKPPRSSPSVVTLPGLPVAPMALGTVW